MGETFSIEKDKSLFSQIKVMLHGKEFMVRRIARKELKELNSFEKEMLGGNLDAAYSELEYLFDCKDPIIDDLEVREVSELINHISIEVFKRERFDNTQLKNKLRPGAGK